MIGVAFGKGLEVFHAFKYFAFIEDLIVSSLSF